MQAKSRATELELQLTQASDQLQHEKLEQQSQLESLTQKLNSTSDKLEQVNGTLLCRIAKYGDPNLNLHSCTLTLVFSVVF